MARAALLLVLLAGLGVGTFLLVRQPLPPLSIRSIGTLSGETTAIDVGEFRTLARHRRPDAPRTRQVSYRLDMKNNLDKAIGIRAKLAESSSDDLAIRLAGQTRFLPNGGAVPILVLLPPRALGAFTCRVELSSPDVEGWTHDLVFKGAVVDGPQKGRYLHVEPLSVHLGSVQPGQTRPFVATLRNEGDAEITISSWLYDETFVRLRGVKGGEVIAPGGELQMGGTVVIPDTQGRWRTVIDILSNARNAKRRRFAILGTVEPDFSVHPPRLDLKTLYPPRQKQFLLTVQAREGLEPFTVRAVENLQNLFEVVDLGGEEPALEKLVKLRVSRSAPAGEPVVNHVLRMVLDPGGVEVRCAVSMQPQPSIYASPSIVRFKPQPPGKQVQATILLATFPGRTFKVTSARSRQGLFEVEVLDTGHPPVQVKIRSVKGIGEGQKRDRILLETTDPDTPRLEIEVRAEFR